MLKPKEKKMLIEMVIRETGGCERCGSKKNLQIHHIQRRSAKGKDVPRNLMIVCEKCHKEFHKYEEGHINK